MKQFFGTLVILTFLLSACQPSGKPVATDVPDEATNVTIPTVEAATQEPTEVATQKPVEPTPEAPPPGALTLTSTAFVNEGDIPAKYGQVTFKVNMDDGASFVCNNFAESTNVSPELSWANIPDGAVSLALVMGDQMNFAYPDAPADAIFPHWVVYNLSPDSTGLPEGLSADAALSEGALQGKNAYPSPYDKGYGGPCPGAEKHRYVFTLYVLDAKLDLPAGANMKTVLDAAQGHILDQVELTGYYTGT